LARSADILIAGPASSIETACAGYGGRAQGDLRRAGIPFIISLVRQGESKLGQIFRAGRRRGPGDTREVKRQIGVPVLTDVHGIDQMKRRRRRWTCCRPAFLCRQTDFISAVASAASREHQERAVPRPGDMKHVVAKAREASAG